MNTVFIFLGSMVIAHFAANFIEAILGKKVAMTCYPVAIYIAFRLVSN